MYLSAVPSNKRVLNITISELAGKGKTGYFNETSAQKSNGKQKHTFEIKRMKSCLLSVNFDGKSVDNTFQYRVKAAPKF